MRRAFTLIELLVVVAIIAIIVTTGVVNVFAGGDSARLHGATRDIYAFIRHARSTALASQSPSLITYENSTDGEDPCIKLTVTTAKLMTQGVSEATTLAGERVKIGEDGETEVVKPAKREKLRSSHTVNGVGVGEEKNGGSGADSDGDDSSSSGDLTDEVLFAPISADVVRGLCIKVAVGEDALADGDEKQSKPQISVFSNVDYLIGKYREAEEKKKSEAEKDESGDEAASSPAASASDAPVTVVWQVNGRTDPHRVWIYRKSSSPEKGMSIKVDRFGAAKVLGTGEDE